MAVYHLLALTIAIISIQCVETAMSQSEPAAPIFRTVIPELKEHTKTPIFLPTRFPKDFRSRYAGIVANASYFYMVEITTSPNCLTRPSCSDLQIFGFLRRNANTPQLIGKKVRLNGGATAYWSANQCASVGCLFNVLTFINDGHIYVVARVHGTLADALVLANSMKKAS
jgi:hypothetical protein